MKEEEERERGKEGGREGGREGDEGEKERGRQRERDLTVSICPNCDARSSGVSPLIFFIIGFACL